MYDEIERLDQTGIEVLDDFDQISYLVEQPKKNIVIVPGGKVEPDAYRYLAFRLAQAGYDVTIVKTVFDLAILTPNYGERFLRDDLENVVIGHSLGGTVASLFSAGNDLVGEIVFLASYPIADVTDKRALVITGEFDSVLDRSSLQESESLLPEDAVFVEIAGGNHAQFGWYGPQTGDTAATLDTLSQQALVIQEIILFIE
jgi:pimeloyl-ACP methyl ester carboxylesterase